MTELSLVRDSWLRLRRERSSGIPERAELTVAYYDGAWQQLSSQVRQQRDLRAAFRRNQRLQHPNGALKFAHQST